MALADQTAFSGCRGASALRSRGLLALAFVLACPFVVQAQEIEAWFAVAPEARAYVSVRQELVAIGARARIELLSDAPLADRLREGARKNIAPERLEAALKAEFASLSESAALIREKGLFPSDKSSAADVFSRLDLAMRAGCSIDDLAAALDGAIARKGTKATALSRVMAALDAVVGLPLDAGSRLALVSGLTSSTFDTDRFGEIRDNWAYLVSRNGGVAGAIQSLVDTPGTVGGGTTPHSVGDGGSSVHPPPLQGGQHAAPPPSGRLAPPERKGPALHR